MQSTQILSSIGLTALTTLLSILALFLLTKMMGAKQVSQMTMFDYVIGITIGSSAAELATELEEPHKPLTAIIIYGLVALGISVLSCKSAAGWTPASSRQRCSSTTAPSASFPRRRTAPPPPTT